ncbi:MAG: GAF domain-containing sensor histidine kinase [Bryobacteraceae bacterium]
MTSPLVEAADVLSEAMEAQLRKFAKVLQPHATPLDRSFRRELARWNYDEKQLKAMCAVTPGAAARILATGRPTEDFFEQVEYSGRRLAKLNVPPGEVVRALRLYDTLLDPVLRKNAPRNVTELRTARERLHFSVVLTLNNAFQQVREVEAQAFYDLFRAELEAKSLDELLHQFLGNLTRICQAQFGSLVLLDSTSTWCQSQAAVGGQPDPAKGNEGGIPQKLTAALRKQLVTTRYVVAGESAERLILDRRLIGRCRSYWSVPLMAHGRMAGLIQLGFSTERSWLPRELHLLDAAVEQCLLAAEKARLMEDLAAREEQVRKLGEHMWQVEEEERRRISRELHDEAGQSMLFIRLQLEMLEKSMPGSMADVREKLAETRDVTEKTIIEIRRIIAALSPAVLEQLGLYPALRQLTNRFRRYYPARARLHLSPRTGRLPREAEIITYRLVQECFNNIAKHSSASTVNIHLSSSDTYLELRVEDDGVGFEVEAAMQKRNSYGLSGMRERVTLLGGRMTIHSLPNQGTSISVVLPIRGRGALKARGGPMGDTR